MTKWQLVRRPALFLLFLCSLTFLLALGRPALTDADEAYYAESAREMVERGDWLTPYYNYEQRWQKPVLYYWLTAITYLVVGIGEWSARCWSALLGVGLAFATCVAGRRLTHHDDVGWLAGAIVATSFGCFALARMALPDLPFAFFVTLAIASAIEGRWIGAGLAAGLGFLMKGPLAVVLPGIVLVPIWLRERRAVRPPSRDLALAIAVFAVVGLPWYAGMTAAHGRGYLVSFFVGDNLERFATDRFNEPRSPFFYVPVLLGGLLPWTAYLVAAAWRPVRDLFARRLVLSDHEWRLVVWAAAPLLFFSVSVGKQPRYILPVLPPIAILLARAILNRIEGAQRGDRAAQRELRAATYATAALLALMGLTLARARGIFLNAIPAFAWSASLTLAASAAALAVTARRQRWTWLPVVVPLCAAAALVAIQFGALAGRHPEPVEEMAALVRTHRAADEAIGSHHVFVRNLIFYTGLRQENLFTDELAVSFMQSRDRVLMIVRAADLPRLEAASGVTMARLAEVRYFNTANIKLASLVAADPEREVERVLLVANR